MQLTLAEKPAVTDVLVLERWSEARPAEALRGTPPREADVLDALAAQLTLRLDESQIPLWDQRAGS
jgi:hypothetical protein